MQGCKLAVSGLAEDSLQFVYGIALDARYDSPEKAEILRIAHSEAVIYGFGQITLINLQAPAIRPGIGKHKALAEPGARKLRLR